MKKRFLKRCNLMLGALSMLLAGCHSPKHAVKPNMNDPEPPVTQQNDNDVIELYGVPNADYEEIPVAKYGVPNAEYEIPMLKYGVPNIR